MDKKYSLLVVDDQQDILATIVDIFEISRPDVEVRYTTSGEEALHLIRQKKPDVMLLDIMMPKISGWTLTAFLKDNPENEDIPIIYLTARNDELSRKTGMLSGEDYILKPFDAENLINRVMSVVERNK